MSQRKVARKNNFSPNNSKTKRNPNTFIDFFPPMCFNSKEAFLSSLITIMQEGGEPRETTQHSYPLNILHTISQQKLKGTKYMNQSKTSCTLSFQESIEVLPRLTQARRNARSWGSRVRRRRSCGETNVASRLV